MGPTTQPHLVPEIAIAVSRYYGLMNSLISEHKTNLNNIKETYEIGEIQINTIYIPSHLEPTVNKVSAFVASGVSNPLIGPFSNGIQGFEHDETSSADQAV